jgi:hypothetical protein
MSGHELFQFSPFTGRGDPPSRGPTPQKVDPCMGEDGLPSGHTSTLTDSQIFCRFVVNVGISGCFLSMGACRRRPWPTQANTSGPFYLFGHKGDARDYTRAGLTPHCANLLLLLTILLKAEQHAVVESAAISSAAVADATAHLVT